MGSCAEESRLGIHCERRAGTGFSWLQLSLAVSMFLEQASNWITPVIQWSGANPFLSLSSSPAPNNGGWGWAQDCGDLFFVWDTDFLAFV